MAREELVVRALVEMADTLVGDFDVVELLTGLASRCVELLGISAAGVMVPTFRTSSDPFSVNFDGDRLE